MSEEPHPRLGATGIGVADIDRSVDIVRQPAPVPELGDAVVGFAKDADGHPIELIQA